jgi:hypothetical protein
MMDGSLASGLLPFLPDSVFENGSGPLPVEVNEPCLAAGNKKYNMLIVYVVNAQLGIQRRGRKVALEVDPTGSDSFRPRRNRLPYDSDSARFYRPARALTT